MPSLRFEVRAGRTGDAGYAPTRLRITHDRLHRRISLPVKIKPRFWNSQKQQVTRSHPEHVYINRYLRRTLSEAQNAIARLETTVGIAPGTAGADAARDAVEAALNGKAVASSEAHTVSVIPFARRFLQGYLERGQASTHAGYQAVINKFEVFLDEERRPALPFSDLNTALVEDFERYLYSIGNSTNTVAKGLKVLRTMCRAAMRNDLLERDPFRDITITREKTIKKKLTPDEMDRLAALEDELEAEGRVGPYGEPGTLLWHVQGWFLFSYYGGGMRFSDLALLEHQHLAGGRIRFKMKKTGDATPGVPIVEKARAILDRYTERPDGPDERVFPILDGYNLSTPRRVRNAIGSQNALVNKYLKELQRRAGIETKVSFHLARHTAAWRMYRSIGDVYAVSKLLGHSSVKQTERYLEGFEDDSLDDKFRDVF